MTGVGYGATQQDTVVPKCAMLHGSN